VLQGARLRMQGGVDSAEWRRGSALRGACRQLTHLCLAQLHAVTDPLGLVLRPCGKATRKHMLRTWGRTCLRFYPCVTCTWCCGAACFACPVPAAVLLPAAGMLSKPGRCASGRAVRRLLLLRGTGQTRGGVSRWNSAWVIIARLFARLTGHACCRRAAGTTQTCRPRSAWPTSSPTCPATGCSAAASRGLPVSRRLRLPLRRSALARRACWSACWATDAGADTQPLQLGCIAACCSSTAATC